MLLQELFESALAFAKIAHSEQKRKYTFEPYWTHPLAVAELVKSVTKDQEVIAAALLHDTIEDTNTSHFQLEQRFGLRVANLVAQVTDKSKPEDGNRAIRKEIDRKFLGQGCIEAKTIKLADLIDNSKSIAKYDPIFAKTYMAEKRALLEVLREGDQTLYRMAKEIVEDYYREKQ